MSEEIFVDDVGRVEVIKGIVRVELLAAHLSPPNNDGDQPTLQTQPIHEMVLPPNGFARSFARMKNVVDQLVASGVVTPVSADADSVNNDAISKDAIDGDEI